MPPTAPTAEYRTPTDGQAFPGAGLIFPTDGSGLTFDAGYPLTFPSDPPGDLGALFPAIIPKVEEVVYQAVNDACNTRAIFPDDGQGLALPAQFNLLPDISLFKGMDGTYTIPVGQNAGQAVPPIPVVRGWPTYPGAIPAIGVAQMTQTEDPAERTGQAGFAGDVFAVDELGNVLATCAYYAEPLRVTVVVELIHENRDERDRLHDQLWRVLLPLRHVIPSATSQVKDVSISDEKQDLPLDEQPQTMYVSLFTVEVAAEALIPTEIVAGGVITRVDIDPTPITIEDLSLADTDEIDLT